MRSKRYQILEDTKKGFYLLDTVSKKEYPVSDTDDLVQVLYKVIDEKDKEISKLKG